MNNDHPRHGIPWLAVLLGAAAVISFFASSNDNLRLLIPALNFIPLVILVAIGFFFWGLVRYLTSSDQVVRNNGVHILLWSLLVIVASFVLWSMVHLTQNTFGIQGSSAIAVPSIGIQAPQAPRPPMYNEDYGAQEKSSPSALSIQPAQLQNSVGRASSDAMIAPYPYPYPGGSTPPATDTRELNKIYYNASLQTRDVNGLAKLVETTVRGNGGRVDQMNTSEKSGYVRFVIPQTKFDAFRDQIEGFVDSRFLSVSIDSQNMLPQKQAIEKQQDYTKMNLDQLTATRKTEMSSYASKKSGIQAQIDANERELAMLQKALQTADEATRGNIGSRQMEVYGEQGTLKNQLSSLERTHLSSINSIDAQIRYANGTADALNAQDENLMEDVATVSGTISINWVSLWDIAHAYMPGYWIPGILLALALIANWWHRKKTGIV